MCRGLTQVVSDTVLEVSSLTAEIREECCVSNCRRTGTGRDFLLALRRRVHVPYFPPMHRPGWLLRLVLGPYNEQWRSRGINDIVAGVTVSLLLIPQGLSYSTLAQLPPINGLYAAIFPSACYTIFGSSMQLAVGPVAIISLVVGQLVNKTQIVAGSPKSADFAAELCLAVGTILAVLSFANVGNLVRFISYPVMSGFTSGAAAIIGLNQLKAVFGFTTSYFPQVGDGRVENNYEVVGWILEHWKDTTLPPPPLPLEATKANLVSNYINLLGQGKSIINPYATSIFFGLWVPLAVVSMMRKRIRATPARKKSWCFFFWTLLSNIAPLIAIIVGAAVAYQLKKGTMRDWKFVQVSGSNEWKLIGGQHDDFYKIQLRVVGYVPPGLSNILRTPSMEYNFGTLLMDTIPLTLIAYMESYSVARKMAAARSELNILNASQEMWALGAANLVGSVSSAYPVAGSFSRSSLGFAAGAQTPLAKIATLCVVLLTLAFLTESFYYIPSSALSAVIMASISSLIDIRDYWNAWKYNKKDCFLMVWTTAITFIFDTKWGLVAGIGMSVFLYICEVAFGSANAPRKCFNHIADNDGVDVVILDSDLVFINATKVKDFLLSLVSAPMVLEGELGTADRVFNRVTSCFDRVLQPPLIQGLNTALPKAVVIDCARVRIVDLAGMQALAEFIVAAKARGVLVVITETSANVTGKLAKFGILSDELERYTETCRLPIRRLGGGGESQTTHQERRETAFAEPIWTEHEITAPDLDIERPGGGLVDDGWEDINGGRVRRDGTDMEEWLGGDRDNDDETKDAAN